MIHAFEALSSRQRVREIAAKAHADERTVKRVLKGEWKRTNAEERILAAMEELGVSMPLATVPRIPTPAPPAPAHQEPPPAPEPTPPAVALPPKPRQSLQRVRLVEEGPDGQDAPVHVA